MRISDWSSDVCSSDLEVPLRQAWRNEHKFTDCCFLQGCSHQRCDEQSGNVGSLICSTRHHLGAPVAVGCPVSRRLVHAISFGPRLVDGQNAKAAASATADRSLREMVVKGAHPEEVLEPTGMALSSSGHHRAVCPIGLGAWD